MKSLFAAALLIPALLLAPVQAAPAKPTKSTAAKAQPSTKTAKARPAKKVTVAKAQPQAKSKLGHAAAAVGVAGVAGAGAAAVVATKTDTTPDAQEAQVQAIAQQVHTGHIACELGASVTVDPDAQAPGRFVVHGKGFRYYMTPVTSVTGAIRLEDVQRGAVWLQIANKSMLMNQKLGQRLADDCKSPEQIQVAEAMRTNPPPSLLDTPPENK